MTPPLAFCITSFTVTAFCHVLALTKVMRMVPTPLIWVLTIAMFVAIFLAVLTHPARKWADHGTTVSLDLPSITRAFSRISLAAYFATTAYAIGVIYATMPTATQESGEASLLELGDQPIFLTACCLLFQIAALMTSHSALLLYRREHLT